MRVLLIKTSSMGDLVHTLPALTDARKHIPDITFDWLVEEGFEAIPRLHPAVSNVLPVALRRWREAIFKKETYHDIARLKQQLAEKPYDLILDAQGLVKSAWLSWLAKGTRASLDWRSARESLASLFYQRKYNVNFYQHAVVRIRSLFAKALSYEYQGEPDFGIDRNKISEAKSGDAPYFVFLHGTTWTSKLWPESYWIALALLAEKAGYRVKISGASEKELARAERIKAASTAVDFMPRLSIKEMTTVLSGALAAVSVDTGFGHLAAALGVKTISIYGSTNPEYTGVVGPASIILNAHFPCSPCYLRECNYRKPSEVVPACYGTVPPHLVWEAINRPQSSR